MIANKMSADKKVHRAISNTLSTNFFLFKFPASPMINIYIFTEEFYLNTKYRNYRITANFTIR